MEIKGSVWVNAGVCDVFINEYIVSSLLFVGIIVVEGEFKKGDFVCIIGFDIDLLVIGVV